ncbi:hypothetical protein EOA13_27095 [Mesorhizobium sp. M7A.F.Ca.US.011.01.1.1]|uniref:hypothetical protein n=1 Tax=Mesorhizobium sp. M7A.F.Ca.US.011.01.1.1 TaxID=2496741 RepID=UPI000FCAEC19|nr:hypothetical protein [Mesorhizobium sp. M7A.F.Ca.US.011.01.1.1]RUX25527.1 hypothetical protein EOA13_27095 [Mesorhizobium sp. M7A.F.Ca.US.011.01.1.1]
MAARRFARTTALCDVADQKITARETQSAPRIIFPPRRHSMIDEATVAFGQPFPGLPERPKTAKERTKKAGSKPPPEDVKDRSNASRQRDRVALGKA